MTKPVQGAECCEEGTLVFAAFSALLSTQHCFSALTRSTPAPHFLSTQHSPHGFAVRYAVPTTAPMSTAKCSHAQNL